MDLALDPQQQELWTAYERFFRARVHDGQGPGGRVDRLRQRLWSGALDVGLLAMGRHRDRWRARPPSNWP